MCVAAGICFSVAILRGKFILNACTYEHVCTNLANLHLNCAADTFRLHAHLAFDADIMACGKRVLRVFAIHDQPTYNRSAVQLNMIRVEKLITQFIGIFPSIIG